MTTGKPSLRNVLAVVWLTGVLSILLPVSSHAQTDGQVYPIWYAIEVTNTVTANESEIIGTTTVSSVDYNDIEYIGAWTKLYSGSALIASGPEDDENLPIPAVSVLNASIVVGQPYEFRGYFGGCYYYSSPPPPPGDDDDDDDGGVEVRGGSQPLYAQDPYPCAQYSWYWPLDFNTGVPTVQSLTPNSGTIGDTSKSISVSGTNFTGDFGNATVSMSGGITSSANVTSSTSATVTYSIPTGESASAHNLTMSNSFGISNLAPFNVGYPGANVAGLVPPIWTAGTTFPLTITGTGFGTAPSLTIVGLGVTHTLPTVNPGGTQMQTTVSVDAAAPDGAATVTVQPGYTGATYTCGNCNGASPNGTDVAPVAASVSPPQIVFNGGNVAGATTAVYAGQKIPLTITPVPQNRVLTVKSWIFCQSDASGNCTGGGQQDISGGFTGTNGGQPSATNGGNEASDPDFTQSAATFYFVNPGTTEKVTVTVTYTQDDGSQSTPITASAIFTINGPTGNLMLTPKMAANGSGVLVLNDGSGGATLSTTGVPLVVPNGLSFVGITFTNNASWPPTSNGSSPGTYQSFSWVQLINGVQNKYVTSGGSFAIPTSPESGIDNVYPYPNANPTTSNDTPSAGLPAMYGEGWESFSATMYLMWDSALPSGCKPAYTDPVTLSSTQSECKSIPIPLSSVAWHWSGCAINTLANQPNNNTTWMLSTLNGCPQQSLGAPQTANFPEWTHQVVRSY